MISFKSPIGLLFVLLPAICLGLAVAAEGPEYRTWTDASGRFSLTARFVSLDNGQVLLDQESGERISIALDRLSKADQEFVAAQKGENPFKSLGNNPFTPVAPRAQTPPVAPPVAPAVTQSAGPRNIKVNWSRSRAIALAGDDSEWNASPPEAFEFSSRPSPTPLPPKTDFFEKLSGVAINPVAKRAVVGYKLARHGSTATTRIVMCDIERGRTLATAASEGEMAPLALHDNGQHILMRRDEFGFGNLDRLEVWSIEGDQVVRSVNWIPYEDARGGSRDVMWADFVDAGTLATSSRGGKVALWDIGAMQPICHFQLVDGAVPTLSTDRKWIAFCAKNRVGLFDVARRKMACIQETPDDLTWPYVAFSPSGKKIGCIARDQILVWDTATGQLERNFSTPGISIHGAIDFPDDEFILAANQYLIALDKQIKLWQYQGAEYLRTVGGTTFIAVSGSPGSGVLAATTVPHAQALDILQKALQQPDLFVFHKGSTVKLNVSGVPAVQQGRVRDVLTKKLQEMDCSIAANAELEVVASVEGPKQKEVSYMHSGDYKVQEYRTWLKFMYGGTPAWQTSGTNIPGILTLKKGENVEGVLREAGKQPSYAFYDRVVLPEFLQKPSGEGSAGGGQTLGTCRVTPMGFQ